MTGEKALYVNRGFTRYIVGLKQEESDLILNFLYGQSTIQTQFEVADLEGQIRWQKEQTSRSGLPTSLVRWSYGTIESPFTPLRLIGMRRGRGDTPSG